MAFLWSEKGAGPFSSPMLLKSGRVPRWCSLLLVWFGPAAFKQFNHPLELSRSLPLPPFPLISHEKEIFKCNPSLMAGQQRFQSKRTDIFTFYILNTREIDIACRSPGGFEVMEHLRSSHQLKLLPWHPGMNTDKGIKRWTDLMHGLDTSVPGKQSRLKSTQIRHYCLTRNYRLHCRSKEKRTNPDRIHNNYFTCLKEPSASKWQHGHICLWWHRNKQRGVYR